MNKHFRVSGSTFQKLEELEVSAAAVLRRAGLPQGYSKEPLARKKPCKGSIVTGPIRIEKQFERRSNEETQTGKKQS
jgi:hypothetical protein